MHVASFDIFDTLLTRDVAVPRDLFAECGIRLREVRLTQLEPTAFARSRVQAEIRERKKGPVHEITLTQIYRELGSQNGWSPKEQTLAAEIEMQLEAQHLHPVPEMAAQLSAARKRGKHIVFISDMYLPSGFLRDVLARHGLFQPEDHILVSCEHGCSKSDGRLYACVRKAISGIETWEHVGDNHQADVISASQNGIRATLFNGTQLTRYESAARGIESIAPLWRSRMAGGMRLARLRNIGLDEHRKVVWETACNVTGPLLTGFVQWCLDEAQRKGIHRLYFVARDGQILLKIARRLCQAQKLSLECRYLYGSRQAWRPASIETVSPADWTWLLPPDHHLSLRNVLARIATRPEAIETHLQRVGFARPDWDRELSGAELSLLSDLLLDPEVSLFLREVCEQSRCRLIKYLDQEGFSDGVRISLVDIGWFGNLQRCLDRALRLSNHPAAGQLHGFYFGLFPGAHNRESNMAGYWDRVWSFGGEIQHQNMTLFEVFTAADHGSVTGYCESGESIVPTFEGELNSRALDWGLKQLQDGILEFCKCSSEASPSTVQAGSTDWQTVTRQLWHEFHERPSTSEARAWGSFDMSGQSIEKFRGSLAPVMTNDEIRSAIKNPILRPTGWWAEGTLALSDDEYLRRFLTLRRWRRALPGVLQQSWRWLRSGSSRQGSQSKERAASRLT